MSKNSPTGRRLPSALAKKVTISCRITEAQRSAIAQKSLRFGINQSDYIRALVLGEPLHPKVEVSMINELRRTVGLLKHIHNESKGSYSQDTAEAIKAVKNLASYLMTESKRGVREQLDLILNQALKPKG